MKKTGMPWESADIEFLKENYPKYGSEYCVKFLQREKKAIVKRANILKIKFLGTRFKYSKENLEPIVKKSKHIKDVLERMDLRAAGGNYKVINDYIKKYNIDTSHFETATERLQKSGSQFKLIPLKDILVKGSKYNRTALKERLYKEGIKKRECEECGQGEIWKGKKMSLILDHENGIHNDNRLINLRILCPNCNSTLDTHAGKNNKKAR